MIPIPISRYYQDSGDLDNGRHVVETASKYPIEIYDFENDNRFDESDFRDPYHLNFKGSRKFTRIIDRLIWITLTLNDDRLD